MNKVRKNFHKKDYGAYRIHNPGVIDFRIFICSTPRINLRTISPVLSLQFSDCLYTLIAPTLKNCGINDGRDWGNRGGRSSMAAAAAAAVTW